MIRLQLVEFYHQVSDVKQSHSYEWNDWSGIDATKKNTMPIPALAGLIMGQIGQSKQNATNLASTWWLNNDQKKFSREMYQRQREDSLADWNMNNLYNSPAEQMKRFKEAGLNPNLIYGQTNTAAPVRSSSVEGYSPEVPRFSFDAFGENLAAMYDMEAKDAQKNNLLAAAAVAAQEAALKAVQIENVTADTKRKGVDTEAAEFNLSQARKLSEYSLQAAQLNLAKLASEVRNTTTQTNINLRRDEREALSNSASLQEAWERIKLIKMQQAKTEAERQNIKQEMENKQVEKEIKELDRDLKKGGVQPGDWFLWRKFDELMKKTRPGVRKLFGLEPN